jgi:hypothetical protein
MSNTNAIKALLAVVAVVIETLEECPEGLPEGHLYAILMPMGCTLPRFNQLVELLIGSGKVKKQGHLLLAA